MEKGSFIVAAGSFCRQRKKQGNLRLFGRPDWRRAFVARRRVGMLCRLGSPCARVLRMNQEGWRFSIRTGHVRRNAGNGSMTGGQGRLVSKKTADPKSDADRPPKEETS